MIWICHKLNSTRPCLSRVLQRLRTILRPYLPCLANVKRKEVACEAPANCWTKTSREWVQLLNKHVVLLYIRYQVNDQPVECTVTCFIISVDNRWYLVTAAHCLSDLKTIATDSNYKIIQCRLFDDPDIPPKTQHHLPFELGFHQLVILDPNDPLMDIGLIPLKDLDVANLKAVGARPIELLDNAPITTWIPQGHLLIGAPYETFQSVRERGTTSIDLAILPLRVHEIDPRITNFETKSPRGFYGAIEKPAEIESIEGMSGGPIFAVGLDENGNLVYRVEAIQSTWRKSDKHIIGPRIAPLATSLRNLDL